MSPDLHVATQDWHRLADGRLECDVCPRRCRLREGQRGLCFVRARENDRIVLTTYGRSSGFCIDPIEKKPLFHFLPGTAVLSFGTAGCNLTCRYCQNWDMSKARDLDVLCDAASPDEIAAAAVRHGCRSVAFTYNDPVVFMEYAIDVARACRMAGIATIAVTAGYVCDAPRRELFADMDAANVDLKAFSDDFYRSVCGGALAPVLDTLRYIRRETAVWLEITTLLVPGANDDDDHIRRLSGWIAGELGPDVPLHFTAFHPDWRMRDRPPTPAATLSRARAIALAEGMQHVYTGNVRDRTGGTTICPHCDLTLVVRDGYEIVRWRLLPDGCCPACGHPIAGRIECAPGGWGPRRRAVRLDDLGPHA